MIKQEPKQVVCADSLSGALVGLFCMFSPHLLFWAEAQLQVCTIFNTFFLNQSI